MSDEQALQERLMECGVPEFAAAMYVAERDNVHTAAAIGRILKDGQPSFTSAEALDIINGTATTIVGRVIAAAEQQATS